jgi:hypothetical protein
MGLPRGHDHRHPVAALALSRSGGAPYDCIAGPRRIALRQCRAEENSLQADFHPLTRDAGVFSRARSFGGRNWSSRRIQRGDGGPRETAKVLVPIESRTKVCLGPPAPTTCAGEPCNPSNKHQPHLDRLLPSSRSMANTSWPRATSPASMPVRGPAAMPHYYDRQGQPLTPGVWAWRFADSSDKRLARTTLPDGRWVSTVWLGFDHPPHEGLPLIFETTVFGSRGHSERVDGSRYSTEAEAIAGHTRLVAKWDVRGGFSPTPKQATRG